MSNRPNRKAMVRKPRQNSNKKVRSAPRARDSALMLRPEYSGQPVAEHTIDAYGGTLTTTITTGAIAVNASINSALIQNFATRFAGYTEFRITKAVAIVRPFSTVNPGILLHWFSEDDTAAPTSAKAINALSREFSASDVMRNHSVSYTPHDPAQQTWTLVSSGAPVIGYYKLYTDNASFGSSATVTAYASLVFRLNVQFRGFI